MKKVLKLISIALTVVLIIGIFSCATPVLAAEVTEKDSIESTLEQYEVQVENSENQSLYEIEEERDEFTKVFQNSNGTKTAIISATPVHYETANGWEDIDNTLIEKNETSGKVYKNNKNDFTVTIPQEISDEKELKIEKDDYSISFELEGSDIFLSNKKIKGEKKNKKIKSKTKQNEINTDFLDKTSEISFENVGEITSVEYEVTSTGLKENIILEKKPENEVEYKYNITSKKLTAQLNENNSVTFKDADGKAIFEIPAPIMYDAQNTSSNDIEVTLSGKNGKYTLTYKPSFEWLCSDVSYPVVVDPVINTVNEALGIKDAVADSANPNDNYNDLSILSTYKSDTGNQQSFIDISNNYIVKNGAKIKTVLLCLYYEGGLFRSSGTTVAAYTVTSDWNESTLTYNNRPTTVSNLIERKEIARNAEPEYIIFDVTKAYTLKEETYGVCIRERDSENSNNMLRFSSSETATLSQQPFFAIEYYETMGVEEQFDYHTFDVGRAGTAYFNDFTEQVYIERDELGLSGINMPVQIKRYYNSLLTGTFSDGYEALYNIVCMYGLGWNINYNQTIELHDDIDGKPAILYCNGNGKVTYFEKGKSDPETGKTSWNEKPDKFSNSDGYTLEIPSQYDGDEANNLQFMTIKDSSGQVYEFNSSGLLTKINSGEENSTEAITISYGSFNNISKIVDGVGREYRFSYTEYEEWQFPLLASIQAFSPSGTAITVTNQSGTKVPYKMTYTYSFSNYLGEEGIPVLSTATYPDGETVYYTVNDNLISLKNIDGYSVEFAFNTANTVISEKVYKENGITSGGQLTINDENAYEKSFVDLNGTKITKQFDMYGRTINTKNDNNINDSITRTYSEDYNAQGSVSYSFYNTYEQSYTGEETNLVTNGSFNSDLSGWVISDSSKVKRITGYDCKPNNETPGSLQMSGVRGTTHYAAQVVDVENGVSGDEYRLDYFVINTKHSHMVAGTGQIDSVLVYARNNIEGIEDFVGVAWVDANPYNENWQKYSFSFDIDFEYNQIVVIAVFKDQYGTVRFDDISLVNTYKPPINQVVENENANENTDENTNENTDGNTPTENDDECSCAGCTTQGCPCTENCSETCTEPACNRGYSFENTPQKTYFSITDGEKTMEMEQTVSGNYYSGQKDINGIYTGYNYNQLNGQLNYTYDSNSNITEYSYDAMSRLNKVYNEVNAKQMETLYSYENDRIASITHNDFSYNYEYDDWGNTSVVKTGGQTLVSYSYGDDKELNPKYRDRVNCITYGNGDYTKYSYHNDGSIDKIQSYTADDVLTSEYDYYYDENGNIEKILNTLENTELEYTDNGMFYKKSGNSTNESLYFVGLDENQNPVESFNGLNYTKGENSVSSDSVTGETATTSSFISPTKTYSFKTVKDYFGRTKYKDTILRTEEGNGYTGSEKIREAYEYAGSKDPDKPDVTTSLVSKYTITHGTYVETVDEEILPNISVGFYEIYLQEEYLYDYDSNGNITRIRLKAPDEDGNITITELNGYIYDSIGQLIREDNYTLNKTFVYTYDKGGNIVQKKEYDYTTGDLGQVVSTVNYGYDSVWKDKLTAYGETAIQTDEMGNPLNYCSTLIGDNDVQGTLEWNGRQLSAAVVNGKRYEYTYNADGMRTRVKVYENNELNNVYYYIWENGKITGYYISNSTGTSWAFIKMLFDGEGDPIGFEMNESNEVYYFYFRKNIQGDITAVCESDGNELIRYYYDAWGGVAAAEEGDNPILSVLALICTPITYRGYNYDAFTGLYYLQSRYYNATYGRFLNADDTEILQATQGTPLGANLFAYCNNNPVNMVDFGGREPVTLAMFFTIVTIIAVVILFIVIIYHLNKKSGNNNDKIENAYKLIEKFKEFHDLSEDYWLAFYYHAKNVVEYGTGVNKNPSFPYYDKFNFPHPYTHYCAEAYMYLTSFLLGPNERWADMTPERRIRIMRNMAWYDSVMYNNIVNYFAGSFYKWGTDTYEVFWGIVKDMATL